MTIDIKFFMRLLATAMLTLVLIGCGDEGPLEEAGEEMDEAVEEAANNVEDACEDIKESADADDTDC